MTYKDTIDYLYAKLPMFSRIGAAAIKKDLHNTFALCEALNNPHKKFKTIHIAGHSKGGPHALFAALMLQSAGHTIGTCTTFGSPAAIFEGVRKKFTGINVRQYRNGRDIVTELPSSTFSPFVHVAELIRIGDQDGDAGWRNHGIGWYIGSLSEKMRG